jgi:hypothetical protein
LHKNKKNDIRERKMQRKLAKAGWKMVWQEMDLLQFIVGINAGV